MKVIEFLQWCIPICIALQLCVPGVTALDGGNCTIDARCPRFDVGESAFLIPHPDCSKFYKCALGKACEYFCPANLHFNPTELACDWPHRACCSRDVVCKATTQGSNLTPGDVMRPPILGNITFGDDWSANMFQNSTFVVPDINKPSDGPGPILVQEVVVNDRQEQGTFQLLNEVQNLRPNGNGELSEIMTPYEDSSRDYSNSNLGGQQSPQVIEGHHDQISISRRPGCFVDSRCSSTEAINSEEPFYLKHTNCEKFYMCSGGEACEVACPPGLHFNVQQSRCDYPDVACCDSTKPCARSGLEVPLSNCILDSRCSIYENPMNPTHLRHPTNCDRFYKCAHGKACEIPCPPGEHFSVALNRCEFPQVACCDRSVPCVSSYAVYSNEPIEPRQEPVIETDLEPSIEIPSNDRSNNCWEVSQCPESDTKSNQLMRHNDCTKFFSCFEGTICEFVCPPGLHFNERLKVCDKPENAQCSQSFA